MTSGKEAPFLSPFIYPRGELHKPMHCLMDIPNHLDDSHHRLYMHTFTFFNHKTTRVKNGKTIVTFSFNNYYIEINSNFTSMRLDLQIQQSR